MLIRLIVLLVALVACEGPIGPVGPQGAKGEKGDKGERGLRGESASAAFVLIEKFLDDDAWNGEFSSYYLRDFRIQPTTVVEVYVKKYYTNTGEAFYLPMLDWLLDEDPSDPVMVHVSSGRVRFYDPRRILQNEVVAVAIIQP